MTSAANSHATPPDRKTAALALAAEGFYLLPVKAKEKRPDPLLAPDGFKNASRDPDVIGGWFDVKPNCNLGIACGPDYGLLVLDVDVREHLDGWASFKQLYDGWLTRTADTPSTGAHFYFKHPGNPLKAHLADYPGLDFKGADGGGYVLAPPSTLPAGVYAWKDPEVEVAPLPPDLLALLASRPAKKPSSGPVATLLVPEGRRHGKLVELGAVYRGKGLQPDEIETLLWDHARRYFDPPFNSDNPEHRREIEDVVHWYGGKAADDGPVPSLSILNTAELLLRAAEAPGRMALDPLLPEGGNLMVYGPAGVGKSHLALAISLTLAEGGSLLDWTASVPLPVLYVDGEMPLAELGTRLRGYLAQRPPPSNLLWLAARANSDDLPDLADEAAQARYLEAVETSQAKVVVFDNLSCLRETTAERPENSVEAWYPVAAFLRRLNARNIATITVHHASKGRTQRGSSAHTAVMDTVLALWPPGEGQADPQAANDVEIVFEKHRRFCGDSAQAFRAKAVENEDGHVRWERSGPDPLAEDVARLRKKGQSFREIARTTQRSKSAVQKALIRAKAQGLISPKEAGGDD